MRRLPLTHSGLFEFRVMPFGLCNAPATFQSVLVGLIGECCMEYIVIMGKTFEEHLENLRKVLDRLRKANLRLKAQKCKFMRDKVGYLGHVVSKDGIEADSAKVSAMRDFPTPTDLKALHSFLGLAAYYRRFVPLFSTVAGPLHGLTRKGVDFMWSESCEEAFRTLKRLLTQAPVLAFPDFALGFLLETDASGLGLGAQEQDGVVRLIAYSSRTLQAHEKNYGATELEGLGVVWAVKHFRHYLYGHECRVYTDHQALKALLNTPHPSGRLARWGLALQELELEIVYRPGKKNANADTLSRCPLEVDEEEESPFGVIAALGADVQSKDGEPGLRERQLADAALAEIENGSLPSDPAQAHKVLMEQERHTVVDGVLYRLLSDN